MNEDIKLKTEYKETFTEIHAPEALGRKVRNMSRLETKKVGLTLIKKLAVTAAAVGVLFTGSNGIVYAATGSTWIENVVVYFSDSGCEADVNGEVGEDGIVYTVTDERESAGTVTDLTEEIPWIEEEYDVRQ